MPLDNIPQPKNSNGVYSRFRAVVLTGDSRSSADESTAVIFGDGTSYEGQDRAVAQARELWNQCRGEKFVAVEHDGVYLVPGWHGRFHTIGARGYQWPESPQPPRIIVEKPKRGGKRVLKEKTADPRLTKASW